MISKYVKKENIGIQTDEGKYAYMAPSDAQGSSFKEWSLSQ